MDYNVLIDQFEAGGRKVKEAIAGLTREDLLAFPVPGTWSIQQIVIHLQDSELVAIDRMKRILAEEKPLLVGYDENKFVANLSYEVQSAQDAAEIVDLARRQFARVLRRAPESAWARFGIHNERGKVTLGEQLEMYVKHLERHLSFAVDKRNKLGKPLR
jgi:hypothetical protein